MRSTNLKRLASRILAEHDAVITASKRTIEHALRAGDLLLQAKVKVGHGGWLRWLAEHCPAISDRSCRLYMRLARSRAELEAKVASIADLTLTAAADLLASEPDEQFEPEPAADESPEEPAEQSAPPLVPEPEDPAKSHHDVKMAGEPYFDILQGDIRELLPRLPEVHCVLTSPPYFQKIPYGDSDLEIGHEQTVEAYIAGLVDVFKAIPLHPAGSIWVNLGDKRAADGGLLNIPGRFCSVMQAAGFLLIDLVVWAKSVATVDGTTYGNFLPEPCRDRLNGNAHELLFHFTKSKDAWADTVAVQIPRQNVELQRYLPPDLMRAVTSLNGRNLPNAWLLPMGQTSESHSGVFSPMLCERPIAMTCPPFINPDGTLPRRLVEWREYDEGRRPRVTGKDSGHRNDAAAPYTPRKPVHQGWEEIAAEPTPGVVLDPFAGTGTSGEVALRLGRSFIGCELYEEHAEIARRRCAAAQEYVRHKYGGYGPVHEMILNPPPPQHGSDSGGPEDRTKPIWIKVAENVATHWGVACSLGMVFPHFTHTDSPSRNS